MSFLSFFLFISAVSLDLTDPIHSLILINFIQNKMVESKEREHRVDLVLNARCNLGESPVFDARVNVLYFVDINSCAVHSFHIDTKEHNIYQLDEPVGMVGLTDDPRFLIACTERAVLEIELGDSSSIVSKRVIALTPEEDGIENMRFNDGKISPQGTLIVGRMHSRWRDGNPGTLYKLDSVDGKLKDITPPEGIGLPNGLVWTRDGSFMYLVDSCKETITKYPTNSDVRMKLKSQRWDCYYCNVGGGITSTIFFTNTFNGINELTITPMWCLQGSPDYSRQEDIVTVSNRPTGHKNVPDGMAIDSDGNLWVALGESGSVCCYDGTSGELVESIKLPIHRPTSCIFGCENLGTLFVTTRVETGPDASANHGAIFAVNIAGVKGMAHEPYFARSGK